MSTTPAELDGTVVLPVHNGVDHLDAEIRRIRGALDASGYSYEIVVDDGSTDGSTGKEARVAPTPSSCCSPRSRSS